MTIVQHSEKEKFSYADYLKIQVIICYALPVRYLSTIYNS